MIYNFTLTQVTVFLGLAYLLFCGAALWKYEAAKNWLLKAHRKLFLGIGLFAAAMAWIIWILATIDLMEYTNLRVHFIIVVLIMAGFVIRFMPDLLAARAYGLLLLLLSKILLDAAFLRDETAKYVIVILAYIYVIEGMILVAAPYFFRDCVAWLYEDKKRAHQLMILGCAFGLFLLALGIFFLKAWI